MEKKRKHYIDIIKIVCIFIVCYGHSGPSGFAAHYYSVGWLQVLQAAIAVVCKASIPLFFMCTGALLLSRDEPATQLWKKRVLKYILITVIFTTLYYVYLSLRGGTPIDIPFILKTMYNTWGYSHSGSYWFLYSYIGFLILLPLLRPIARALDKNLMFYMIVVNTVACGVLPILEYYLGMQDLGVEMVLITKDVFFYPFLGHYIEKCDFKELCTRKNLWIFFGMSILAVGASTYFTVSCTRMGAATEEYIGLFQMYIALFVYVVAKNMSEKAELSKGLAKVITEIGMCTFGVYLIHGIVYVFVDDYLVLTGIPFTYPIAWLRAALVFVASMVIVWICRRIPILKNLF